MAEWKNWSGSVSARPAQVARPKTEDELARIVREAGKLRVVGAGHSFMPLCETDGTLLSLAELEGAIEFNADKTRVWAPAGASLANLTAALWEQGVSLINQGDVNPQALAGAISTGTHGTGRALGSLSTAARAFRLMRADGSVVTCSETENLDLFQAQRLSLGMLGVATRIEIDVLPAYHLEEKLESHDFDAVAESWNDRASQNRHAEFFVFPYSKTAIVKTLNPAPSEGPLKQTTDMDESGFRFICDLCAAAPWITSIIQPLIVPKVKQRRVGPSYQIFPSDRTIRFEEMEYQIPADAGFAALREVIAWVKKRNLPLSFPFEFRTIAADDICLSPFNKGPCVSISMHQYAKMPWREMFAGAEQIFRTHGGRPHWAKRHTLNRADVDALYPQAQRFRDVRAAHDPSGKFLNTHLVPLFGPEPA